MLASTADELLLLFRHEVSDLAEPYLWSDYEAYAWMTEATDALLKQAGVQNKVLRLPFTSGNPLVKLPRKILHILAARVVSTNRALLAANTNDTAFGFNDDYGLRTAGHGAMFEGSGHPASYVRDYETRALRLVPAPNFDGEIEIQCTTTLGAPLEDGIPLPTQDAEDQRLILHYTKWRAYAKHDAETEDLVRAREYERLWRTGVVDREVSLRNQRRAPGSVRMEWF